MQVADVKDEDPRDPKLSNGEPEADLLGCVALTYSFHRRSFHDERPGRCAMVMLIICDYVGKILNDAATVGSLNIKEKDFHRRHGVKGVMARHFSADLERVCPLACFRRLTLSNRAAQSLSPAAAAAPAPTPVSCRFRRPCSCFFDL